MPVMAFAEDGLTDLANVDNWSADRTEPESFTIKDGKIKISVKAAPVAPDYGAYQGRKALTNAPLGSNWSVKYTFEVTEQMLETENINASLWIQIDKAGEYTAVSEKNCVDWCIIQYIRTADSAKWQSWDGYVGAWNNIDVTPTVGEHEIKVTFDNGVISQSIDGTQVNTYEVKDDDGKGDTVLVTSPVHLIAQGRSYGNAFDVSIGVPEVTSYAVAKLGDVEYYSLQNAIEAAEENDVVTLINNAVKDIVIPADKTITLDLNGKTLTNVSDHTIINNGTLTIKGEGTVDNVSHARAAIHNAEGATLVLDGGSYTRSKENGQSASSSGGNSFYNIRNYGHMTINEGVTVEQDGHFSSMIENGYYNESTDRTDKSNIPTMIITGGLFDGGLNTIKNDDCGVLTINGGTFKNVTQTAVMNFHEVTINGGTFESSNNAIANTFIDANLDKGELTITGGTFTCGKELITLSRGYSNAGTVKISGGNFASNGFYVSAVTTENTSITDGYFTADPSAYLEDGYVTLSSNVAGYNYMVEPKNEEAPEVVSGPAEAGTKVEGEDADKLVEEIKNNNVDAPGLGTSANDVAQENTVDELVAKADAETVANAENVLGAELSDESVAIVVEPYLGITITGLDTAATDAAILTLDIESLYNVVATNRENSDTPIDKDSDTPNAVNLLEAQSMTVTTPVTVTIPLTKTIYDVLNGAGDIYVLHKNTYYYAATLAEKIDTTTTYSLSFTTTNGFSPFAVLSDSRTAAVSFTDGDPASVTYIPSNVGNALPEYVGVVPTGKYFAGWTFTDANGDVENASGSFTSMSSELLTALSEATAPVTGTAVFNVYSGGGTVTTYDISIADAKNGTVTSNSKSASAGASVTLTVTPAEGYVLSKLTVTDESGKELALANNGDKYTFTMPASDVSVAASFVASDTGLPFTDVAKDAWYFDAVAYAFNNNMMDGVSDTGFNPGGTATRGMIVTILYRMEGEPAVSASDFTDVLAGKFYSDAVAWAAANKIVDGYEDGTFKPMNSITREQMAAIFYRYANYKGLDVTGQADLSGFADADQVSSYALPALQWACYVELIEGTDSGLAPKNSATRAQVATIMMRFCEDVSK